MAESSHSKPQLAKQVLGIVRLRTQMFRARSCLQVAVFVNATHKETGDADTIAQGEARKGYELRIICRLTEVCI